MFCGAKRRQNTLVGKTSVFRQSRLFHDVFVPCRLCDQSRQRQQRDQVREYHQAVEQVGQVPYEVNVQCGADNDADNNDSGIRLDCLVAEQRLDVLLTEEIPADDGREREEQHTDGNECAAERAEGSRERRLRQLGALKAVRCARVEHAGGQDDHCGQRQNDKGVDEYRNDSDFALILRTLYLCQCVCVRGGTHAGLVGEQAACNAVAHCLAYRDADCAAEDGLRVKRRNEDGLERRDDCRVVEAENDNAACHIEQRHDRDDLLGNGSDTADAAEEDERRDECADDADRDLRCAERRLERYADRVCLHHVAGEAEREDDGNREETGEKLAETALKTCADVVDRAAGHVTALIGGLVLLRKDRLAVDGGHTEESGEPHPENRARAAGVKCGSRARDVAGADLRRDSGRQRLKRAHAVRARLFTVERKVAEQMLPAGAELADLDKARADGKHDAGTYEEIQQQTVPYDVADLAYPFCQYFHCHFLHSPFLSAANKKPKPMGKMDFGSKERQQNRISRADETLTSCAFYRSILCPFA